MAQINDLTSLALAGIQDLYDAENKAVQNYPQLIEAATSPELKQAFQEHMEQSRQQAQRLEQIAQKMGISPQGQECVAIQGLIQDAQKHVQMVEKGPVLDAALIGGAQKVEHLEIAAYGTARSLAQQIGDQEAVQLLEQTLQEEKQTDEKLTRIAESMVNQQAAASA